MIDNMPVAAVLFDMDGLMVDTERLYVQTMHEMAASYGKQVSHATLSRMMGRAQLESINIFLSELHEVRDAEQVLAEREVVMLEKIRTDLLPMPGLFELLDALRNRVPLWLATGSSRTILTRVLQQLNIADRFTATVAGSEVARGKPDPLIYQRVIEQLGVNASDCVVLEDSANGVRAGHAAGCRVIAVPNDDTRGQDFHLASVVAADLTEARGIILDWLNAAEVC